PDRLEDVLDPVAGGRDRLQDRRSPEPRLGPATEADHVTKASHPRIRALATGLVDDGDVADLEDGRRGGLAPVAHARCEKDDRGVSEPGALALALPGADGLDDDDVAARRVEDPDRLRRGPGDAAEVPAAGHRPDVDLAVERELRPPEPVTEQCAVR